MGCVPLTQKKRRSGEYSPKSRGIQITNIINSGNGVTSNWPQLINLRSFAGLIPVKKTIWKLNT